MVARDRVRVVTPSFVYRRGGVLTTLHTIQARLSVAAIPVLASIWGMQTLHYILKLYFGITVPVDLASVSVQASGLGPP